MNIYDCHHFEPIFAAREDPVKFKEACNFFYSCKIFYRHQVKVIKVFFFQSSVIYFYSPWGYQLFSQSSPIYASRDPKQ